MLTAIKIRVTSIKKKLYYLSALVKMSIAKNIYKKMMCRSALTENSETPFTIKSSAEFIYLKSAQTMTLEVA